MEDHQKVSTEYLKELSIHLRSQGFTVFPRETRDVDVEHDGKRLCQINDQGNLGYFEEDITGKEPILDGIRETARTTREYMTLIEEAPPLEASGLGKGYKLLAEFNGTVLGGHMTKYGAEFITWDWTQNRTSLWQGHYFGIGGGCEGYRAAKQDFTVRSGLLPKSALFTTEQLTEIYRSVYETLDGEYPLTDERRKLLEGAAGQIEDFVPDLDERVDISNAEEMGVLNGGGIELR